MTHYMAVYGTLRKGLYNHHRLGKDRDFIGEGIVKGFGMYSRGAFPALSREGERTDVVVELYHISDEALISVDALEGYPSFYTRKLCPILINGETVPAWVYYMKGKPNNKFVPSGDWVQYVGAEQGVV